MTLENTDLKAGKHILKSDLAVKDKEMTKISCFEFLTVKIPEKHKVGKLKKLLWPFPIPFTGTLSLQFFY